MSSLHPHHWCLHQTPMRAFDALCPAESSYSQDVCFFILCLWSRAPNGWFWKSRRDQNKVIKSSSLFKKKKLVSIECMCMHARMYVCTHVISVVNELARIRGLSYLHCLLHSSTAPLPFACPISSLCVWGWQQRTRLLESYEKILESFVLLGFVCLFSRWDRVSYNLYSLEFAL